MRFGIGLPTCREGVTYPIGFASAKGFVDIAQAAEELGFSSLWTNDHSTTPRRLRSDKSAPPNLYEPATVLSYVAARTSRIRLVHGALVSPVRGTPVLAARQAATLDVLSDGRHTLGLCIGGYVEEFTENEAGATPRPNRGRMLDETIQLIRALFDQPRTTFDGEFFHVEDLEMYPKPVQQRLPIHYAGNVDGAAVRTGLYADGWIYIGLPDDEVRRKVALMHEAAVSRGRDPKALDICPQIWVAIGDTQEAAEEIGRASGEFARFGKLDVPTMVVGTPDVVLEKMRQYEAVGATEVGTIVQARTVDELIRSLDLFAREVLPHFS